MSDWSQKEAECRVDTGWVLAYLVCPMRCTRPIACSSTPVFSKGSTSSTWVASMIFNPLEPEWNGSRSTLTSGLVLNSVRLFWWGEGGDKDLAAIAKATGLKSLCAVLGDVVGEVEYPGTDFSTR